MISEPSNSINVPLDSSLLSWVPEVLRQWQKPKPIYDVEKQPVSFDELKRWNESIDRWSLCGTEKLINTCSLCGDKHYLGISYNRCNDRKLCPRCAWFNARKEAWTTWYWLMENIVTRLSFKTYLTHIVLTLPKDLQGITDKELSKAVKKVMEYQDKEIETTYCYVIHTRSSSNPFKKHKQVHVLALNIGLKVGPFGNYQFKRLSPYFKEDGLKKRWKEALGMEGSRPVDLYVSYTSFWDKEKVIHQLAYMYRYDVWDFFKYVIRGNRGAEGPPFMFKYDSSMKFDSSKVLAVISQQKKRVTWVGFLSSTRRNDVIKSLGEVYSIEEIRKKVNDDITRCPYKDESGHVCGARLVRLDNSAMIDRTVVP